jgi:hypothetical protein
MVTVTAGGKNWNNVFSKDPEVTIQTLLASLRLKG